MLTTECAFICRQRQGLRAVLQAIFMLRPARLIRQHCTAELLAPENTGATFLHAQFEMKLGPASGLVM